MLRRFGLAVSRGGLGIAIAMLAGSASAQSPRELIHSSSPRKALLVGNDEYTNALDLKNAVNDVTDLGDLLSALDFDVTT